MKQLAAANAMTKENASLQGSFGRFGREMHQTADLSGSLKGLANPLICRGCRSSLGGLQPKLVVGPVDDEYERVADRVAEQAVSMTEPPVQRACPSCEEGEPVQREPLAARITPLVQRQAQPEEEEEIQTKSRCGLIQREAAPEEEEELQTAPEVAGSKGGPSGPDLEQSLEQARSGGRPLAESFRGRMESAFGADFSSVRIHADEPADRLSRSIQARAFTRGNDIFLKQGEYQPASADGQRLLAHELTHVVQQKQGSLRSKMPLMRIDEEKLKSIGDCHANYIKLDRLMTPNFPICANLDNGPQLKILQRRSLQEGILNMVGENHDISEKRRSNEKLFCKKKTGGDNYLLEYELAVESDIKKESADPKLLRFCQMCVDEIEEANQLINELDNKENRIIRILNIEKNILSSIK